MIKVSLLAPLILVSACVPVSPPVASPRSGAVLPGIEVLLADSLHLVRGKRVGLITNHSGRDRRGISTIDLLHRAPGVTLVALYGPEHGLRGAAEAGVSIASSRDSATGLPIHSLYGETRVPTPEMLRGVDVLIYDIQDVGARVYTYQWTMALAAAEAGKAGIRFLVLDRPNPIRADRFEGGLARSPFYSFVGLHDVPMRYGFTPGELMKWLAATGRVKADVAVIPMRGYRRSMWWEETGIPWVNPSPNLRDMDAVVLYPGTVLFEGTNLSEGRGTDRPFRVAGAPWLTDAADIAAELNAMRLPGVRFVATTHSILPSARKWGGQTIPMIEAVVTDRNALNGLEAGVHMLRAIYRRHSAQWEWRKPQIDRLAGTDELRAAVEREGGIELLLARWRKEAAAFEIEARPFLIYR